MPGKPAHNAAAEKASENAKTVSQMMLQARKAIFGEAASLTDTEKELSAGIEGLPQGEQLAEYHTWMLNFLKSVSEKVKKSEELAASATRHRLSAELTALQDSMTGIYNRRYFSDQIEKEISKIDRSREAKKHRRTEHQEDLHLSLLFLDLDHFKKINDILGHDGGDIAIREFANIVKSLLRDYDTFARIGGEEFVVMLDANQEDALKKAEQIRQVVEDMLREKIHSKLETDEQKEAVSKLDGTVSIGVTSYRTNDEKMSSKALIKKADLALYHSKNTGRNRVTAYSENTVTKKDDEGVSEHMHV